MLRKKDVAKMLGVCTKTVDRYVKEGKLRCIKYGQNTSKVFFNEEDVKNFINAGILK